MPKIQRQARNAGMQVEARDPDEVRTVLFIELGTDKEMGALAFSDARLDRSLDAALAASKMFVWDKDRDAYIVDLSDANPPYLLQPHDVHLKTTQQIAAKVMGRPLPKATVPSDIPPGDLRLNPKWKGTETGYASRYGWMLDYVEDRGDARLPRGERGKHWQLTHVDAQHEEFFKNKKLATQFIVSGLAAGRFFASKNDE